MVVESRTSYRWAYLRRNKKPPIKLIVWFVKYIRRFFGLPVCVIRTDGGGELWGSLQLRKALSEMDPPVLMEPTSAETSSVNGKAERSIGLAGITTQLLLGMSNLEVISGVSPYCTESFYLMFAPTQSPESAHLKHYLRREPTCLP
jgi:hypothetical protein